MKSFISLAVMVAPICIVWYFNQKAWETHRLRTWGMAIMASAAATYVGARFFGLYALGRTTVSEGDTAEGGAIAVFFLGVALVLLHFVIAGVRRFVASRCGPPKNRSA